MKIWQLPEPDDERPHGLKYSLYYGKDRKRLVGYGNEKGKGITAMTAMRIPVPVYDG